MLNRPVVASAMSRTPVLELHRHGNSIPVRIDTIPFNTSTNALDTPETQPLVTAKEGLTQNASCTTFCIGATMCIVVITVVTMTTVMYVRVDNLINQGSAKVMPFLDAGLKDVASVLDNSATMSRHVTTMTEQGEELLTSSVPKLVSMLNQTQRMIGRFEQFSSQPSINIGMGRV